MKLLSVVLPTYNVAQYIEQAIDSVLAQSYSKLELIIIDDNSQDRTVHILREYAAKDNRIRLIENKTNIGPGASRNLGLQYANGEYLTFMDHDDWQDLDRYEKMISKMENDNADACFSYAFEYDEATNQSNPLKYPRFDSDLVDLNLGDNRKNIRFSFFPPWVKILRTQLVKRYNIKFAERGVKFDDVLFHSILIYYLDKISIYNTPAYFHRFHGQSISGKYILDKTEMHNDFYNSYLQAIEYAIEPRIKKFIDGYYFKYIDLEYLSKEQKKYMFNRSFGLYFKKIIKKFPKF
jgi:glycosyltransferase involved in cell wall biosynthesis